jgi:polyisoprenoid-binding protein YceI
MSRTKRSILLAALAVILAVVVGPWVYINVVKDDAPEALTLEPSPTTQVAPTTFAEPTDQGLDGEWVVGADSVVGYRVKEILFGQSTEGVGRTSAITGSLTVEGREVTAAEFEVDMTTLQSDSSRRDRQVNGRILDTATYPTATFSLRAPIALADAALAGEELVVEVPGMLTLRGVQREVLVALVARLTDGVIEVNGSLEIVFADWSIPDPSISAISVEDRGLLEFLIRFER